MKAAVVYISLTGNTAAMAERIIARLSDKAEVDVFDLSQKDFASMDGYDVVAFGCPAMGSEVLEEDTFEPAFSALESSLSGRRIALFGSYGWGDGEWMRAWQERCIDDGAILVTDPVIAQEGGDESTNEALDALADSMLN